MASPNGQGDVGNTSLAAASANTTFEATRARESTRGHPDPIHWSRDASYRNQAYRHLHHQEGLIGTFQVRLLEAAELKRSHWSALALGPVKLLGLSKAHGAVSSFCTFSLKYQSCYDDEDTENNRSTKVSLNRSSSGDDGDSKPRAKPKLPSPTSSTKSSPVVPHDDNPVWTDCVFDLPLNKGPGVSVDGHRIFLTVRVDEDATAAENILPIPGVPSGGDSRLLGTGTLDLSPLCLGQVVSTGQAQVGVLDTWIPIRLNSSNDDYPHTYDGDPLSLHAGPLTLDEKLSNEPTKKGAADSESTTGRVRVLVSYRPNGMEPQQHDVVALESFARHGSHGTHYGTCPPILPPLLPMTVVDISGPWLLVEYQLRPRSRQRIYYREQSHPQKACLRLHRNCVFVVERKNLVDETINLALLPADIIMSTPLGQGTAEFLGPIVIAGRQLLMPALLSAKLVWMAVRTTTLASLTGVQAATTAMVDGGISSLLTDESDEEKRKRTYRDSKYKYMSF